MLTADLPTLTPDALDRAALAQRLNAALQATIFSSRLTVTPRRIGQLAAGCADSFQRYLLREEDNEAVSAFGQQLAQDGLGHASLLALIEALQGFVWEQDMLDAARAASRYGLSLLAGYMAARESYLLAEQERTRVALGRAQQHAGK